MDCLICECMVVGPVQTNCYFLYQEDSRDCVVVDPGEEAERIQRFIEEKKLHVKTILLTHGHFDHITAASHIRNCYQAEIYAAQEEKEVLEQPQKNLSVQMGGGNLKLQADRWLRDGEEISLLGRTVRCILTPGHTCGGMSYYIPKEGILFSGDTLFEESVGRTDFPTGSMSTLIRSIREKLFVLPDAVRVYPGHGMMTSIGNEKKFNPFAVE